VRALRFLPPPTHSATDLSALRTARAPVVRARHAARIAARLGAHLTSTPSELDGTPRELPGGLSQEAELSQCTFKPAINTVPDHIKKLAVRPASTASSSLTKPAKVPSYGGRHGY
jgi:hypothetical protein